MTEAQKTALRAVLPVNDGEFHHGDCEVADAEAHNIAVGMGMRPIIHPPFNQLQRAFCEIDPADVRKPAPYLERNKNIVSDTDWLVAVPGEFTEQLRSGTWSTVRFARKSGKRIVVILPDGTIGNGQSTRARDKRLSHA